MTTFRNRMASVLWIFMGIWMLFLMLMTYVVLRDGPPPGYPWQTLLAVLFVFWAVGLGATAWATARPTVRVDVTDSGALDVTWRTPFGVRRRRVAAGDVLPAAVVECRDSDGDPYYVCRVQLSDGTELDLSEGHDRPSIQRTADRFNACRPS